MKRRKFLTIVNKLLLMLAYPRVLMSQTKLSKNNLSEPIVLFLCGDVMTGRGIDQILPYPSDPRLYEPYARDAQQYVDIAEEANGPIPKPVDFAYVWGDALKELELHTPDVRIVNLETSITTHKKHWPAKGIHYRMHPKNISCLSAAKIDCCVLANNHVLDWGHDGLIETLDTLHSVNIKTAGAGSDLEQARAPAVMEVPGKGRVVVFSYGLDSSGVTSDWAAQHQRAGVNWLPDLSDHTVERIINEIADVKRGGDIVVVSIHWGGNWGYDIPREHQQFAHELVDQAGIDIVHGHSSHHPLGIEVYNGKPIIYGCGDFLNDYEGISGYERYRDDLSLMYLLRVKPGNDAFVELEMIPMQIKRFRLHRASQQDTLWLKETLNRESRQFGHHVEINSEGNLILS